MAFLPKNSPQKTKTWATFRRKFHRKKFHESKFRILITIFFLFSACFAHTSMFRSNCKSLQSFCHFLLQLFTFLWSQTNAMIGDFKRKFYKGWSNFKPMSTTLSFMSSLPQFLELSDQAFYPALNSVFLRHQDINLGLIVRIL